VEALSRVLSVTCQPVSAQSTTITPVSAATPHDPHAGIVCPDAPAAVGGGVQQSSSPAAGLNSLLT